MAKKNGLQGNPASFKNMSELQEAASAGLLGGPGLGMPRQVSVNERIDAVRAGKMDHAISSKKGAPYFPGRTPDDEDETEEGYSVAPAARTKAYK